MTLERHFPWRKDYYKNYIAQFKRIEEPQLPEGEANEFS